jgi:hypothetical protein
MMNRSVFSLVLLSLAFLGCGGGSPPTDSGIPSDSPSPIGDGSDNCAAPNFVCCLAGSTSATPPSCENGRPVCPEANPPYIQTPGTTCAPANDAGGD